MLYVKPRMTFLGPALGIVQGNTKGNFNSIDQIYEPSTPMAYEADE